MPKAIFLLYFQCLLRLWTGTSYALTPDITVYGIYGRGDSPGGLNVGGAALLDFDQQQVDSFELGVKSQLFDRRLQLNVALFENQYSDLHLSQNRIINGAITPVVTNAGEAKGRGIDLDVVAMLSSNLRLGLQYTYVDSEITDYDMPAPPAPQLDLTGVPLVRSPKHSINTSITYAQNIGPGEFQLTALHSFTSSYTNDYLGEPAGYAYPGIPGVLAPGVTTSQVLDLFKTGSYSLTNLNASYSWDNWQVSGNIRNLFDREYIATVLAFDLVTVPLETPGAPRTYEVSVRYNF
jgi:iron complex outermembrane recepter protein